MTHAQMQEGRQKKLSGSITQLAELQKMAPYSQHVHTA